MGSIFKMLQDDTLNNPANIQSCMTFTEKVTDKMIEDKIGELKPKHPVFAMVLEGIHNKLKETVNAVIAIEVSYVSILTLSYSHLRYITTLHLQMQVLRCYRKWDMNHHLICRFIIDAVD
jgi:hypothetical protein